MASKTPKPMKVTKANVTRVLTAAGYPKWSYHGMVLTPGPSVEDGVDVATGQPVIWVGHRTVFGCVHRSDYNALHDKKPGFYRAIYARVLSEKFKVSCRIITYRAAQGKAWIIEPLTHAARLDTARENEGAVNA